MDKAIIACIVIILCGVAGVAISNRYKLRTARLYDCEIFLKQLRGYIEYNRMSTSEIFVRLNREERLKELHFIKHTAELLEENKSFPQSFGRALEESNTYGLTEQDKELLKELCEFIGCFDGELQCERIEIVEKKLSEAYSLACEDYKTKGKLVRTISICCGVAAAILLL